MSHFIVFQRTGGHCANWLIKADTLKDAISKYVLWEHGAGKNGPLETDDLWGGKVVYNHPLAFIEAEEKVRFGGSGWNGWEIRELREEHFEAEFAEVFCSENPFDIGEYVECCRPLLHRSHPRSRARGFVWYLKEGPLVTFYRSPNYKRRIRFEVLGRYLLAWDQYPHAQEWIGNHDDILEQMKIEYPSPQARP